MPYRIVKVRGGYQVISPNHPKGFSKNPMTHDNAVAQMLMLRAREGDEIAKSASKLHTMRKGKK